MVPRNSGEGLRPSWRPVQRRLGEMIKDQKDTVGLAKGGQPYQATGSKVGPVAPTLADAGIDKKLSSHARRRSQRRHRVC